MDSSELSQQATSIDTSEGFLAGRLGIAESGKVSSDGPAYERSDFFIIREVVQSVFALKRGDCVLIVDDDLDTG